MPHTLVYSNVELRGPGADTNEESSFLSLLQRRVIWTITTINYAQELLLL